MNDDLFDTGLEIRKAVLGKEFVEQSIASADDFNMPMQRLTTEYCWGAVWGREEVIPKRTIFLFIRSLLCRFPAFNWWITFSTSQRNLIKLI